MLTDSTISYLQNAFRLKIERASFACGRIPRYVLLDKTRNIHSYIIPCELRDGVVIADIDGEYHLSSIIAALLQIQYSQLDRPLFFIINEHNNTLSTIEGNEIKEMLLEQVDSNVDINTYILKYAYDIKDVIYKIRGEL